MAQNTTTSEDQIMDRWEQVGTSDPSELLAIIDRLDGELEAALDRVIELEKEVE